MAAATGVVGHIVVRRARPGAGPTASRGRGRAGVGGASPVGQAMAGRAKRSAPVVHAEEFAIGVVVGVVTSGALQLPGAVQRQLLGDTRGIGELSAP